MIAFSCSACRRTLRVAADLAGKKVRCPEWKEATRVPASEPATLDAPSGPASQAATLPPAPGLSEPATLGPPSDRDGATLGVDDARPSQGPGRAPARVPGYEILGELGRGGM